ncbi:malonate transporter [Jannaschia pagri]|uniref:Malonate transporter n=1 Tax=Jannaschia pagri TaxID=2829797 RepID=A0ABQ4NIZ0_9RHOB|nr:MULTISPECIES: AEC family transporter [unclassified Jannaschia]GIT90559.1 malonate transporter [Jannaschia sp. AI_61]GIT94391.1 malonate transporter [Jannaschia sp. AI_62]
MLDVLDVTVPVFLIIGAGYLAVWRGLFSQSQVDGLMVFTQRFAIPCLLFLAVSTLDLAAGFDWRLLTAYYSGSLVCFLAGILGALWWLRRGAEDAVAVGFAAMFANTVLLGLPIAERAFGAASLQPNYAIIALHAASCYLIGTATMEAVRAGGSGLTGGVVAVARSMSRNSLMLGVAAGLAVNLSGLPLPGAAQEAVSLIARAALPAALFGLGGVLVQYRPEGDARGIALVCAIALILHPAWAWGMGHALALDQGQIRAAVLTAAMAPGVNAYLFAAMHGRAVRISASSVLIGTAISVLTVSGWLLVLR